MESEKAQKKIKKKNFLVPLKAQDKTKGEKGPATSTPLPHKKAIKITKDEQNVDGGNKEHFKLDDNIEKKKGIDGLKLKESKKAKKVRPPAQGKSLSDSEYENLFRSVLERVMSENTMGTKEDNEVENETKTGKTGYQCVPNKNPNQVRNESEEKSDEVGSIASEDVDVWADSPCNNEARQNQNSQLPLKPKSVFQKKAERKGILKPKQLFQDDDKPKSDSADTEHIKEVDHLIMSKDSEIKQPTEQKDKRPSINTGDLEKVKKAGKETCRKVLKDKIKKKKEKESCKSEFKISAMEKQCTEESDEEKGTWIQCSNKECSKWRYVDGIEDPILVPSLWECKMNPDKEHNSCDLPEVDFDESEHICTKFTIGSLVWAKMDGYPWWPGMIEADPDYDTYFELLTEKSMNPFQYHVTFFDDHVTRAWIKTSFISPYIKGQEPEMKVSKGRNLYKKEIQRAITNAEKAMDLSLQKRINTFGFLQRYKKSPGIKGNGCSKSKYKSSKQPDKEKKTWKNTEKSSKLESNSSEDFSDIDDLIVEDTEYNPVGTKSRRMKTTQENKAYQASENKSNGKDVGSDEPEAESNPGTCQEDNGDTFSARAKLDPDVFTMELVPAAADGCKDHGPGTKLDLDIFTMELDTSHPDLNNDGGGENQDVSDKIQKGNKTRHVDDNHLTGCKEGDAASISASQDKVKDSKKSKTKLKLKSMSADSTTCKEKFKAPALSNSQIKKYNLINKTCEESDCNKNEIKDSPAKTPSVENKEGTTKKKKSKSTFKSQTDKEKNRVSEHTEEKYDGKTGSKSDDIYVSGHEQQIDNSSKKEQTKKKSKRKQQDNSPTLDKGSMDKLRTDNDGKILNTKEDSKSETESDKKDSNQTDGNDGNIKESKEGCSMPQVLENSNKKTKNKCKKTDAHKSKGDSDKENLDPSLDVSAKEDKNKEKKLKRKAKTSTCLNKAESSEISDPSKAKKAKPSQTSDDKKTGPTNKVIKVESSEIKQLKLAKKKPKNFAAPLKVCKSSDREVPELSHRCDKDSSVDMFPGSGKFTKTQGFGSNNDQHVVPDMIQESEGQVDVDTAHPDSEEEEELDLNIDVQKVEISLPHKILNDSDDSDAGDADLELPTKTKVVVEDVEDGMQAFGRFAGRCTDHGSESDPMELIED